MDTEVDTKKKEVSEPKVAKGINNLKTAKTNNQTKKINGSKRRKNKKRERVLPLADLKLGSEISGYVTSFTFFGAFIKINYDLKNKGSGGYALLHKSQLSDERINDISQLFQIGELVENLRVIQIDYAKGEVGLSLRKKRSDRIDMKHIPIGRSMMGTVSDVVGYGAFVDIGADVKALLHISKISQNEVKDISEHVNKGDKVYIRIIDKDEKKKTLAASMIDEGVDDYIDP